MKFLHIVHALPACADHPQPDAVVRTQNVGRAEPRHRQAYAPRGKSCTLHEISPINFIRHDSLPLFILAPEEWANLPARLCRGVYIGKLEKIQVPFAVPFAVRSSAYPTDGNYQVTGRLSEASLSNPAKGSAKVEKRLKGHSNGMRMAPSRPKDRNVGPGGPVRSENHMFLACGEGMRI